MDGSTRKKRPTPERTGPRRSWLGDVPSADPGDSNDAREGNEPDTQPDARETSYRAVNNAYQLIDEYMRQGQKMAENLWIPLGASGEGAAAAFNAPERFMRAMGDMTMAWVEVMQQFTESAQAPENGRGKAGPFGAQRTASKPKTASGTASTVSGTGLTVSVESVGRVTVSVQLSEAGAVATLVPTPLRPLKGDAAAIGDVRLELREGESPVLHVVVPEGQPAGVYNGLLLARDTERPRGTINLVVSEPERRARD